MKLKASKDKWGDSFGVVFSYTLVDIVFIGAVAERITAETGYGAAIDERQGSVFVGDDLMGFQAF